MIATIEYTDAAQLIADAKARRAMFYAPRVAVSPAVPQRKIKAARMAQPHNFPPTPAKIIEAARFRDWLSVASPEALKPSDGRRLLRIVSDHCEIPVIDITSDRRTAKVVLPRQVACYILRHCSTLSLPAIGRMLGGRDHTTILHAVRKITARLEWDRKVKALVADILAEVEAMRADDREAA